MAINLERFISNACCNSCQSFYDHYVEANVRFRSRLGMKAVIIRRQLGHCCDWCASLAGIYDPYNAPDDIYKRHSNCRCLVTYKTQDGYQNVWNKKIYQTQREARVNHLNDLRKKEEIESKVRSFGNQIDFYVGLNGKTLLAKYSDWIGENQMNNLLSMCKSEEAKKVIRADYRKKSFIGDGGTADIRRFEKETGINCGRQGRNHAIKVKDLINQINKVLSKKLPPDDIILLNKQLAKLKEVDD